ncbi:hypothetical protein [Colwellia piezophila]|uniref:hypothetical protein n=1 Tax=Colwellia piezophila TaxID=211668 RepID=UPI0003637CC3|nr:hypothetical protein [Colwellia piezophila]
MLFLFLGYEVIHLFILLTALSHGDFTLFQTLFAVVFSAFIDILPVIGYFIGKKVGGVGISKPIFLICFGIVIALIESALLEVGLIPAEQTALSMLITTLLFFTVAFIPAKKNKLEDQL